MEKRRCAPDTICMRRGEVVVKGDALLLVPTNRAFTGPDD